MRRIFKAAATPLVALGAVCALAMPAAAAPGDGPVAMGSNEKVKVYDTSNGYKDYAGYVKFKHKGDWFHTYRQKSPGNRIYIRYDKDDVADRVKTIDGGLMPGDRTKRNTNLPEGTVYNIRGCVQVDGASDYCSGWQKFTA
jgi:hypothetical protein